MANINYHKAPIFKIYLDHEDNGTSIFRTQVMFLRWQNLLSSESLINYKQILSFCLNYIIYYNVWKAFFVEKRIPEFDANNFILFLLLSKKEKKITRRLVQQFYWVRYLDISKVCIRNFNNKWWMRYHSSKWRENENKPSENESIIMK